MSDHLRLTGLRVRGYHGVFDFERRDGQDFIVDADLELGTQGAAVTDDLVEAVDYGVLATDLAAVISGEPVNLIETLAHRLVEVCLERPPVLAATITVHKPQAPVGPAFTDVSVTIRRER